MKELSIERMEVVSGGISNRQCLANGLLFTTGLVVGFFFPPAWVASGVALANSVECFN